MSEAAPARVQDLETGTIRGRQSPSVKCDTYQCLIYARLNGFGLLRLCCVSGPGWGGLRVFGLRGRRGKIVSAAASSTERAQRMQQSAADRTQGAAAAASGRDLLSFFPLAGNAQNIKLDMKLPRQKKKKTENEPS